MEKERNSNAVNNPINIFSNRNGSALPVVMLMASLSAIFATQFYQSADIESAKIKRTGQKMIFEALAFNLSESIDCRATMEKPGGLPICPQPNLTLVDISGNDMGENITSGKYSGWYKMGNTIFKAECRSNADDGIAVTAVLVNDQGKVALDPLNDRPIDEEHHFGRVYSYDSNPLCKGFTRKVTDNGNCDNGFIKRIDEDGKVYCNQINTDDFVEAAVVQASHLPSASFTEEVRQVVDDNKLAFNTVDSRSFHQANESVIKNYSLTGSDIPTANVLNQHIAAQAVSAPKIAEEQIDSAKVIDGSIAHADLTQRDALAFSAREIADGQLARRHFQLDSISSQSIKDRTIKNRSIRQSEIQGEDVIPSVLESDRLKNNSVLPSKIADGSVTTAEINNADVAGGHIADSSLINEDLADQALSNGNFEDGSLTLMELYPECQVGDTLKYNAAKNEFECFSISSGGDSSAPSSGDIETVMASYYTFYDHNTKRRVIYRWFSDGSKKHVFSDSFDTVPNAATLRFDESVFDTITCAEPGWYVTMCETGEHGTTPSHWGRGRKLDTSVVTDQQLDDYIDGLKPDDSRRDNPQKDYVFRERNSWLFTKVFRYSEEGGKVVLKQHSPYWYDNDDAQTHKKCYSNDMKQAWNEYVTFAKNNNDVGAWSRTMHKFNSYDHHITVMCAKFK